MNYVALDFETANHSRSSICSVGIAIVENGNVVEQKSWLVRPPDLYFHPFFTRIHGIRAEDVIDEPNFKELWHSTLKDYLTGKTVLAHNAAFDINVLRNTLNQYLISHPQLTYQCSVVIAKKTWPGLGSYKLNNLAKRFGISFKHHDAAEDALACAKIVLEAGVAMGAHSFNELVNKLYINVKDFAI
ncbi:3'-5' exonuclease [Desulfoscipio gibsoniae]|uniref:DNA polymerase III epsilon subunit-like 3'-5' exonuclease n=1 Tax=Desulfoscipio gibsoniae DSM 7213 TaxID=767817 RepID=R4KD45_9FIRM|nr:3'-5' exonuclease [Desulfoscipio gibsoniae]AGL01098.1 DNA polymerase III epsilon subunit-like 3'-5' exonuclease [Desulfoscipio gibsoniae DSM 7213]